MKIQYWGTAAAEAIPGLFCDCDVCKEAREKGGRYVRMRAQALLDDELLVDFGPDTNANSLKYGCNLAHLKDVLITHAHEDHFCPSELSYRREGFSHFRKYPTLTVHGTPGMVKVFYEFIPGDNADWLIKEKFVEFDVLEPFTTYDVGAFKVTPLPATHGTFMPYVYIIEKGGKTLLYLNDCGLPKPEVYEFLKKSKFKFDLVSYDCCFAASDTLDGGYNHTHMGLPANIFVREKFRECGVYKDTTIDVLTHFSHNGQKVGYAEFVPIAEKEGFVVAYDGMTLEF